MALQRSTLQRPVFVLFTQRNWKCIALFPVEKKKKSGIDLLARVLIYLQELKFLYVTYLVMGTLPAKSKC